MERLKKPTELCNVVQAGWAADSEGRHLDRLRAAAAAGKEDDESATDETRSDNSASWLTN
jgi:hypothetical protein